MNILPKTVTFRLAASVVFALSVSQAVRADSTWTGANGSNGNWSSTVSPGWTSGGVPNAVGAVGVLLQNGSLTTTQDIVAGVTVGRLTRGNTVNANGTWTITGTNSITLNQDGAGAGVATLSNTNTSATANRLLIESVSLILADDLLISNTGSSTSTSGSVHINTVMSGTGNVTISNQTSNTINSGQIALTAANTFTGSVLVSKGAVSFNNGSSFGNSANVVTLGESGMGGVTVQASASNITVANNFVVAAGTLGTTVLGSTSNATTSDNIFSGSILLNGSLTVADAHGSGRAVILSGIISGTGNLITSGTGRVNLTAKNTYTGNTAVSSLGTVSLADNAELRFVIGDSGVNNQINGSGILLLDGDFVFDLSGAAAVGSWTIVDVASLNETFTANFSVVGFTDNGNGTWTSGDYTFSELTGVLTAVPEPSTAAMVIGGMMLAFVVRCKRSPGRNS